MTNATAAATPRRALTDAEHALVLQHRGLAFRVAQRHRDWPYPWARKFPEWEDLTQTALLGLAKAVTLHDPSRGPFPAFAWKVIGHTIVNAAYGDRRPLSRLSGGGGDDALAAVPDPRPGPLLRAAQRDLRRRVRAAVKALPTGERDAVVGTILRDRTLGDLAQRRGVSRQAVCRVRQRGLAELRRRLWRLDPAA